LESQIILCFGKDIKTGYPKWAKVTYAGGRRTLVLMIITLFRNCKF
jgi:hypothetical protein